MRLNWEDFSTIEELHLLFSPLDEDIQNPDQECAVADIAIETLSVLVLETLNPSALDKVEETYLVLETLNPSALDTKEETSFVLETLNPSNRNVAEDKSAIKVDVSAKPHFH